MYLHEYQAKELLREYGILVPKGVLVSSLEAVQYAIDQHSLQSAVVKIQVHAGGRGKAGGIRFAKTAEEIKTFAQAMLGRSFITEQTTSSGVVVEKLLLEEPIDFVSQHYLAITIERSTASLCIMASAQGGVEIEEVVRNNSQALFIERVSESGILHHFQKERLARQIGLVQEKIKTQLFTLLNKILLIFTSTDALLIEINPLVVTTSGNLMALDAKMQIDENALFRQKRICTMRDYNQLTEFERRAQEADLAYVAFDGTIGCMVNGAGLAMATMDVLLFYGGKPANFLDMGGGASEEKIQAGFSLLFSDQKVRVILLNIFGGIMNCDKVASALSKCHCTIPIVVRMEGTNIESAKKVLSKVEGSIIFSSTLEEAAQKAVEISCRS